MNWNDIKKDLENRSEEYWKVLVPGSGNCETMEGEMLRAINRIIYRHWNDGDYFFKGYGCETAGPAHAFLVQGCPLGYKLKPLFDTTIGDTSNYESVIYEALDLILEYIDSKEGKYEKSNVDMFDFESLFTADYDDVCGGCYEEEQWCTCYEDEDDY